MPASRRLVEVDEGEMQRQDRSLGCLLYPRQYHTQPVGQKTVDSLGRPPLNSCWYAYGQEGAVTNQYCLRSPEAGKAQHSSACLRSAAECLTISWLVGTCPWGAFGSAGATAPETPKRLVGEKVASWPLCSGNVWLERCPALGTHKSLPSCSEMPVWYKVYSTWTAPPLRCCVGTVQARDTLTVAVLGQESPRRSGPLRNTVATLKLRLKRDTARCK